MAISIVMPALEMGQETGKLVSWRKQEGDKIAKSDILFEVETDKAVLEVESLGDGILAGVTAKEGDVVVVGKTIAWLVAPGEAPPVDVAAPVSHVETKATTIPEKAASTPSSQTGTSRISPKARRLAKENGIDLANIRGTGADGEILTSDIQSLIDTKSGSSTPTQAEPAASAVPRPQSSVARLMAERTTQSWTTVPHFFLVRDVDATALVSSREKLRGDIGKSNGAKLTHTDLLVALIARTLAKHPRMNASWTGDGVRENSNINIAVAMAVSGGVVAAVISNADSKDLSAIATQRIELTERARSGKLRPADISGGTFTISNLGMYHVDAFLAIITPPQAAILAVGAISDRVVAVNGKAEVRPMMTLTLSSDHRVVDGAEAAQFLHDLTLAIEHPAKALQ
jgi:pyruvate dehydrogenase E2 component (dihydrolipoamide acetyltransferase)